MKTSLHPYPAYTYVYGCACTLIYYLCLLLCLFLFSICIGTNWLQEITWRLLNKSSQETDVTIWDKVPVVEFKKPGTEDLYYDKIQEMESPRMLECSKVIYLYRSLRNKLK